MIKKLKQNIKSILLILLLISMFLAFTEFSDNRKSKKYLEKALKEKEILIAKRDSILNEIINLNIKYDSVLNNEKKHLEKITILEVGIEKDKKIINLYKKNISNLEFELSKKKKEILDFEINLNRTEEELIELIKKITS
jgi:chromosome segregation ATPase